MARVRLSTSVVAVVVWTLCVMAPAAGAAAPQAAVQGASDYVAGRPASLHASDHDAFSRKAELTDRTGLVYVPYERTHRGVPVVGGDFVVVSDSAGHVRWTSVAQDKRLDVATKPTLSAADAAAVARRQLTQADGVESTRLVVDAQEAQPALAYESVVVGRRGALPSRLHVFVDATDGHVLSTEDEVRDGSGTGWINGPTPLSINTSHPLSTTYNLTDPTRSGISCRDYTTRLVLSGLDDVWGNGVSTNRETGCVDALWDVQREWDMLGAWLGRSGINGSGGGYPIYMGLNDTNAFWDGSSVTIGHNTAGAWISSLDVVGHEFGHAIDSNTPGGQSGNGVSEATGDIFGALSEFYANEAPAYDPPDFQIGEEVDLVGSGPIRVMYNPSTVGDPNCYSNSIPNAETHSAAGPFDHWFYLVAEGSAPTDGQPSSPTCNGSSVSGIGVLKAGKIFYSAMLSKTTGMTYLRYRTATLNAAKNAFPGSCLEFNTVKAAWDAVSVPAQSGDPTCASTGTIVVNNPGNRTSTRGVATSLQMTASGGPGAYTWSATGLPAGLSINASTGLISGTPTTAGTSTTTVKATSGTVSGTTQFTWTINAPGSCASPGQKLANPGFESGTSGWTASSGVIGQNGGSEPTHGGTWDAWLDGYGTTHTDTVSQTVAIPSGCANSTLSFWLHIDTAETTTTTQFDKLTVALGSSTLATYSNLNKAAGYQQRTFNVGSFAGQSVTLKFTGTEDSSLQTSFVLDDLALNAG